MKKFTVLLLSLVTFVSCNQTPPVSPFAGTWAGLFSVKIGNDAPIDPAGEITVIIANDGKLSGTIANPQSGPGSITSGTVNAQGTFAAKYFYDSDKSAILDLAGTVAITNSKLVGINLSNTDNGKEIAKVSFSLTKK